jgi:hypothetical protein
MLLDKAAEYCYKQPWLKPRPYNKMDIDWTMKAVKYARRILRILRAIGPVLEHTKLVCRNPNFSDFAWLHDGSAWASPTVEIEYDEMVANLVYFIKRGTAFVSKRNRRNALPFLDCPNSIVGYVDPGSITGGSDIEIAFRFILDSMCGNLEKAIQKYGFNKSEIRSLISSLKTYDDTKSYVVKIDGHPTSVNVTPLIYDLTAILHFMVRSHKD